jgi:hypothetical protein
LLIRAAKKEELNRVDMLVGTLSIERGTAGGSTVYVRFMV